MKPKFYIAIDEENERKSLKFNGSFKSRVLTNQNELDTIKIWVLKFKLEK